MIDGLEMLGLGIIIYLMKALPFVWRLVPRHAAADAILDLLPVALLSALLLPPVILGAANQPLPAGALVVAAVLTALAVSAVTGRAALGIVLGLALLALAEWV